MAVDLFIDESADVTLDVPTGIGIEVLAVTNANAFTVVITAFECPVLKLFKTFE